MATIIDEIMRIARGGPGQNESVRKRRLARFLRRLRVEQTTDRTTWLHHPDCAALVMHDEDWVAKERDKLEARRQRAAA